MTSLDKFSLRESGIDIPGLLDSDPWDFKKSQFIGKLRKFIKILNKMLKISKQNCNRGWLSQCVLVTGVAVNSITLDH